MTLEARAALTKSVLARFPERATRVLLDSAIERELPAGTIVNREHDGGYAMVALVVSGLMRFYMTSPEGRQVTVRYERPGDVVGLSSVVAGRSAALQAVTTTRVLALQVEVLRYLMKRDADVALLLAQDVARSLFAVQGMLAENVFGSVRARVARHLIDLAQPSRDGSLTVDVTVTQQDIADAIGSVREVVSRGLSGLRESGYIERNGRRLTIVDLEGLSQAANQGRIPSDTFASPQPKWSEPSASHAVAR